MRKSTTFTNLVQTLLKEDDVKQILAELNYEDTARKFTAHQLILFFMNAALGQWDGYRSGVGKAESCGLSPVCYSTFSSKAGEVPYELFKRLFHVLLSRCNRASKRRLHLPEDLLLIDSTTITVGKTRLPWALFHGERAGIKLHVALAAAAEQIADAYKARWGIEVFFRWIKQNLNVPILFGTTKNAVFNQLFAALMTYVVLKWLYDHAKSFVLPCKSVPLIRFKENIQRNQLQVEWTVAIARILDKYLYLSTLIT